MSNQRPDHRAGRKKARFHDRLETAQARQRAKTAKPRTADGKAMGIGMRLSLELVVATSIGGLLGYALDWALGSSPWLLIVLVLLGAVAGIRNMLRAMDDITAAQDHVAAENRARAAAHERTGAEARGRADGDD